jgi:hypothetical protein
MHFRIGATAGMVVVAYVMAFFGVMRLLALRYEGRPLADAWLSLYG